MILFRSDKKKINLSKIFNAFQVLTPGFYQEFDDGKDMGHNIEFKSEIELNYNF